MKANVGGIDKVLRIVIGGALLSMLFFVEGPDKWWGAIGVIPLLTGLAGFCPLYTLFGISSCALDKRSA